VIGFTMLKLNEAGTHYTTQDFPKNVVLDVPADAPREQPGKPHDRDQEPVEGVTPGWKADTNEYRVVHVRENQYADRGGDYKKLQPGRYLVDSAGHPVYLADVPISQRVKKDDAGNDAPKGFTDAPQPGLFANIIKGILGGTLQWSFIITGAMIAIGLELCGVSALPVAVGMYISLSSTTPIFIGGLIRSLADRIRGRPKSEAESETSPGVLLSSGYIAGGTLCGLLIAFFAFVPDLRDFVNIGQHIFGTPEWKPDEVGWAKVVSLVVFALLGGYLLWVGSRKESPVEGGNAPPQEGEQITA
jgi:hypothetical protein